MIAPKTNSLLSLVAAAAVLPLLGLYGLLMYIVTPTPTGGMETTVTTICYIAFTFIFSCGMSRCCIIRRTTDAKASLSS